MLTWFAVALAGGAAAVAVGRGLRRTDELGRPHPFPWVSVAVLVVLAVAGAVPKVLRVHQERRLGRAASVLAGPGWPCAAEPGQRLRRRRPRARLRALAARRPPRGMGPDQARPVP